MRTEVYKCDGCGKIKGEANHWFTVTMKVGADGRPNSMEFHSLMTLGPSHYCSQECFVRAVLDMASPG